MKETIKKEIQAKIALILFLLYTIWFIDFHLFTAQGGSQRDWFSVTYGIMAIWGSFWGFIIAKKWGGIKSIIGKAIIFFTVGLGFQELGQLAYTYYIYHLGIEVPYPSIGDLFFYGTIPLYIIGIIYLAKSSGMRISKLSLIHKSQAIIIPLGLLLLSYFFFLKGYKFDWSHPLKVFLDFAVPLGQAIYISLAILTYTFTKGVLGGLMKNKVLFILFALCMQYVADWTFLYQASKGIWYAGGINDYMYLVAYFVMTLGLLQFNIALAQLRQANK